MGVGKNNTSVPINKGQRKQSSGKNNSTLSAQETKLYIPQSKLDEVNGVGQQIASQNKDNELYVITGLTLEDGTPIADDESNLIIA